MGFTRIMRLYDFDSQRRMELSRVISKAHHQKSFHTGDQQPESWLRAFTDLRIKGAHYTRFYLWHFSTIPRFSRRLGKSTPRELLSRVVAIEVALVPVHKQSLLPTRYTTAPTANLGNSAN